MEEIIQRIKSSREFGFAKFYLNSKIAKIVSTKKNNLSNEVWVQMKFNYWNPLTYIYLFVATIVAVPSYLLNDGLKKMWIQAKTELKDGFGFWVY